MGRQVVSEFVDMVVCHNVHVILTKAFKGIQLKTVAVHYFLIDYAFVLLIIDASSFISVFPVVRDWATLLLLSHLRDLETRPVEDQIRNLLSIKQNLSQKVL